MPTILVVDDNLVNIHLLDAVLRAAGFAVRTAEDAEQARDLVSGCDLVLMDILMPDTDGLALAREFRQDPATASIPIIAVTAYPEEFHEGAAIRAGCVGYLTKPVDVHTLPDLLHETIARSRSHMRRRQADIQDAWRAERKRISRAVWKRHARTAVKVLPALLAAIGGLVAAIRAWWK